MGFSSRAWYQTSCSWDWETSLSSSCCQSNLCKLLLIPLGFSSRTRNQAGCSWDWECSLLSSSKQSNLCKLLLVPLSFSSRSWYQASSSWYWETSLPPATPLHLCVEMVLQLLDVGILLGQAEPGDCPRHGQLGTHQAG